MSTGIRLDILEPPLDTGALCAFIAQLPGVRRREDGALVMLGERAIVVVSEASVTIAFQWADNRYGHATAIGAWVLSRHTCRGVDLDYGGGLADNVACAEHLARVSCVAPSTPERLRAAIVPLFVGGCVGTIEIDRTDFVVCIFRGGERAAGLRLPRVSVGLDGVDDDDALLLALYERLDGGYPIEGVELGWSAALGVIWSDARWRLGAVPGTVREETVWTVEDAEGAPVARGFAQGGAILLR